MTKWTYFVEMYTLSEITKLTLLQDLGHEGWELVTLLRLMTPMERKNSNEIMAIFKKPVSETLI